MIPASHLTDPDDLRATVLAICVRNAMEDFHADPALGLTDEVMAALNPVVRRAIWEGLQLVSAVERASLGESSAGDQELQRAAAVTLMLVPDYWEPASELPAVGCLPQQEGSA